MGPPHALNGPDEPMMRAANAMKRTRMRTTEDTG